MAKYLTVSEVANLLGKTESGIRSMIQRKELPYVKIGHSVRFDYDQIIDFLNTKRQEFKAAARRA